MKKPPASDMMRVRSEIMPQVRELNRLIRDGYAEDVCRGVDLLIRSIEHGESFGYGHAIARIEKLEENFQNLENLVPARSPQAEPALAIREADLLRKFGIDAKRVERAIAAGHSREKWIALQTGWQSVGFGRWVAERQLGVRVFEECPREKNARTLLISGKSMLS
jgi:hypothetical protein